MEIVKRLRQLRKDTVVMIHDGHEFIVSIRAIGKREHIASYVDGVGEVHLVREKSVYGTIIIQSLLPQDPNEEE